MITKITIRASVANNVLVTVHGTSIEYLEGRVGHLLSQFDGRYKTDIPSPTWHGFIPTVEVPSLLIKLIPYLDKTKEMD